MGNSQNLANTVWAFATAGHVSPELFDAIAGVAKHRLRDFNSQELANTVWAFAVFDIHKEVLFSPELLKVLESMSVHMEAKDLAQLHQWQLWAHEHGNMPKLSVTLRDRLFLSFTSPSVKVSKLQRSVTRILRMLCHEVHMEASTQLGYSLDALVSWGGHRVGVEVDGP